MTHGWCSACPDPDATEGSQRRGTEIARTDIVLPVSDEMDCRTCHASNSAPAARPTAGWVNDPDPQRDMRLNVLRLHDERQAADPTFAAALAAGGYDPGGLLPTVTTGGRSILCAGCHLSEALPGSGVAGLAPLTQAMHGRHAPVVDPATGLTLDAAANRSACYRAHRGDRELHGDRMLATCRWRGAALRTRGSPGCRLPIVAATTTRLPSGWAPG
jgi:hypothetical protein